MSENTRDWHITLTTKAYLEYTVEADDYESAVEMAIHEYENEGDGFYDMILGDTIKADGYIIGMY